MKELHSYELGTQRKLGILDSEFNNNNKVISKTTTDNGISLGTIPSEHFSRPDRASIYETITKRYFIDHNHFKRRLFALTSSDLAGFYD